VRDLLFAVSVETRRLIAENRWHYIVKFNLWLSIFPAADLTAQNASCMFQRNSWLALCLAIKQQLA